MKQSPLVTTVVPVYNGERFVRSAIESILTNNYDPLEIILVDDGSTDRTAEVAAEYGSTIRYILQSTRGPAAARNHGIALARGAYIAFLDVDDAWSPDKLLSQSGYLLSHPGVDIVQGLIQEELLAEQASAGRVRAARPYYFVNLGSMLFRRSVFEVVGLFDENLQFNEDTDWLFRAWELSVPKAVVHEVVLYYRLHDTNMTRWDNARHSGLVELMKRHRDRLRARDRTRFHPHNNAENLAVYLGWTDIAAAKGLLPDRPGQPSGAE